MNKWCVVALRADSSVAVRYANAQPGTRSTGVFTTVPITEAVNPFDVPLHGDIQLFFVESEDDAHALQTALAERNAGTEYGVCQVQTVALSKPSKPVISKFTEKGLMPA